jgi:hypothetical protein
MPTTAGWDRCVACLTWEPGLSEPLAITASVASDGRSTMQGHGETLLGCFLGIAIADSPEQGVQMVEDGFALLINPAQAADLIDALRDHQRFHFAPTGGLLAFDFIPVQV